MYLVHCTLHISEKFPQQFCISQERGRINVKFSAGKYISITTHNEFQIRRRKILFFELSLLYCTICKNKIHLAMQNNILLHSFFTSIRFKPLYRKNRTFCRLLACMHNEIYKQNSFQANTCLYSTNIQRHKTIQIPFIISWSCKPSSSVFSLLLFCKFI
jgi:hypothetical protein